ncbi:MAG TPA: Crp/Fnr family transcriptional regulator [Candidatus Saccharimonadales bacterium]|nr:Crp/Fnr family transcriptional regulator [Candidatus Saccharimonadales bacterium]
MSAPNDSAATGKTEASAVKAVASVIAEHPFLRGLKPEHLGLLADSAMRMRYEAGDLVFREGDPANRFYLIEQGRISLESHRRDEAPVAAQIIGPGDVLGWSWLFPPYYWHFDARALEPTTAIFFYGTRLREQCEQDHDFGYEIMKRMTQVVIQRLQATRKQLLKARP